MEENLPNKLLTEVEAHTNALIQREQEVNRKLVYTERMMSRYQSVHNIGLSLFKINNVIQAKNELLNFLEEQIHFQKILIISFDNGSLMYDYRGYTDEDISVVKNQGKDVISYLDLNISNLSSEYECIFLSNIEKSEELLGLSTFIVGRDVSTDNKFYFICGYDNKTGSMYNSKYPLKKEDINWYLQIIILWSSFLARSKLFEEINKKANENQLLAEQREREIEDRTRALLDALFDAKKYKLALELADAVVLLVDASSHKIIYANELFEKVTSLKREKAVGRKTLESLNLISLEKLDPFFSESFLNSIKDNGYFRGRYIYILEDKSEKELTISISRFNEEGGGSVYVIIGRDVTNERERIKQEKKHSEDIQKLNQLIINRELRIIELKQRISNYTKQ